MPPKDKSEIELVKKRKKPDQVYNEETKRWVKKDGAVGKRVEEKKKEKEEQEKKDKKNAKERQELESENKRLKSRCPQSPCSFIYCSVCSPFCGFSSPFRKGSYQGV